MATNKSTLPTTIVGKVDMLGQLDEQIHDLAEKRKMLCEYFKTLNGTEYEGKKYLLKIARFSRSKLSTREAKKFLSAAQIKKCTKAENVTRVSTEVKEV